MVVSTASSISTECQSDHKQPDKNQNTTLMKERNRWTHPHIHHPPRIPRRNSNIRPSPRHPHSPSRPSSPSHNTRRTNPNPRHIIITFPQHVPLLAPMSRIVHMMMMPRRHSIRPPWFPSRQHGRNRLRDGYRTWYWRWGG